MLLFVTRKHIWIPVAIVSLVLLFLLNPTPEQHRKAFLQNTEARFFDLPPDYQQIFQQVRSEVLRGRVPNELRYDNLLLFSTLKYSDPSKALTGHNAKTRLLTIGALGFVLPAVIGSFAPDRPAIDQ
jgi:hypothetical protein